MSVFYTQNLQISGPNSEDILDGSAKGAKFWQQPSCQQQRNTSPASSEEQLVKETKPSLWRGVMAAALGSWSCLASGASLGFITPALPLLKSPMEGLVLTEDTLSWVASLLMLGALFGAALAGPLLSKGRRTTIWLSSIPLALSWAILATANAPWPILLTHLLFGVCLGIIGDSVQLYVSEIAHPSHRGALGCVPVLMFNVGTLACYVASLFLDSWRHLAWFGVAVTLPGIVLPFAVPESPCYLASKKKLHESHEALKRLRGDNFDVQSELSELLHLQPTASSLKGRFQALKAAVKPILLVGMVRTSSRLCGIRAIVAYLEPIMSATHSTVSAEAATVVVGTVQWVATLAACGLLDFVGRRLLLISSQAVMAFALLGMAFGPGGVWPLLFLSLFIVANSVGLGPVSGLLLGELVAQQHRSVATSATGSFSWVVAFLVTKTFFDLEHLLGGMEAVLALYAAFCALGSVTSGLWIPETKGASHMQIEQLCEQHEENQPQFRTV
ncbi:facilitated trehalose transporter Tret1-like [Cloeon dipterum]|uniref:facilitated trehalose transporter Tret1-like n=1 Tax=Cloeon dipterum TaxID=197152 RepID=UPI00321F9DAC